MKKWFSSFLVGAGIAVLLVAIWKTQISEPQKLAVFERSPEGIMGTSCRLLVVMDYRESKEATKLLDKAEFQLRHIESLSSNWIEESEISRFNDAGVGAVEMSSTIREIVDASYQAWLDTKGAFDVTCRPLIEKWKKAGKEKVMPSLEEIQTARSISSWELFELSAEGRDVLKKATTARMDLGGVAKGYAIDKALESMIELGAVGALVDVGGDIRVYGTSAREGGSWRLDIQDPVGEGVLDSFEIEGNVAVCTSGTYARFVEIDGERYSHILDPVSGYPTRVVPSVTVIAKTAMQADVWATALSVLGASGLEMLDDDIQAKMVIQDGSDKALRVLQTDVFPE